MRLTFLNVKSKQKNKILKRHNLLGLLYILWSSPENPKPNFFLWLSPSKLGLRLELWCITCNIHKRVNMYKAIPSTCGEQNCPVPRVGSVYENVFWSCNVCNSISCWEASGGGVAAEPDRTRIISLSSLLLHVQSSSAGINVNWYFSNSPLDF